MTRLLLLCGLAVGTLASVIVIVLKHRQRHGIDPDNAWQPMGIRQVSTGYLQDKAVLGRQRMLDREQAKRKVEAGTVVPGSRGTVERAGVVHIKRQA